MTNDVLPDARFMAVSDAVMRIDLSMISPKIFVCGSVTLRRGTPGSGTLLRQQFTRFQDFGPFRLVSMRTNPQQFAKVPLTQFLAAAEPRGVRGSSK